GGVKRYLHEKINFVQQHRPADEHILIIPGPRNEIVANERSRTYAIRSPLVSRSAQYRALLDLRRVDEIIERERPDIVETSDPYQLGWAAINVGRRHGIPVVAFYHSHFPEAYLRWPGRTFGRAVDRAVMTAARSYVRHLYNQFDATLVASAGLAELLRKWNVRNVRRAELGVNTKVFTPGGDMMHTRDSLGIPRDTFLLLYVGRLIAEKNTSLLAEAFSGLAERYGHLHLLVVGDGQERKRIEALQRETKRVTWLSYAADPAQLAAFYRAADLFVHPSVEETFGLVALESQACGTPVVGIRGSLMDEVILHDQTDWATEATAAGLTRAIERMAARRDLRALGAAAAQAVAERYSWTAVFERIFSVYDDVVRL
ncbi:MAG TPA: glycosyltransferase, partial [Chthoniobacterales bacterium]